MTNDLYDYEPTQADLERMYNALDETGMDSTIPVTVKHPKTNKPTIHWANEYATQPKPLEWVVQGVINKGSLNIWYGDPGVGKTWAAIDLCVAIANNEGEWLSRKIKSGTVLIVDEESGENRLANRVYMTRRGHGAEADIPLAFTSFELFNFREEAQADRLAQTIRDTGAILVIVDTLADVTMGADENSVKDMLPALINLRRVAEETGAAIVVLHHPNKSGSVRGSSSILGKCDSLVKVSGSNEDALLTIESEKTRDDDPFKIAATKFFSAGLFNLSPVDYDSTKKARRLSPSQQYVMDYLTQKQQGTTSEIVNGTDLFSEAAIRKAINNLQSAGIIKRIDEGGTGRLATWGIGNL